jgi:O-antigen ligase
MTMDQPNLKISNIAIHTTRFETAHGRRSESTVFQKVGVLALCITLIFAILAFGAVDDWSTFTLEAATTAVFLVWVARQIIRRQITLSNHALYPPTFLFFGILLAQIGLRQSAYGYVTKHQALLYIAFGILFLIAAEWVTDEGSRRLFAQVMTIFGALYAFFALVQGLRPNGRVFWIHSPQVTGALIYGSYVNSNHYAGLMVMLVPIPVVLCVGKLLKGEMRVLAGFCAALMATTIFLSLSRGGMLAFLFEMALFAALILPRGRNLRVVVGLIALGVVILVLLIVVGNARALGRLGDLSPGIRWDITKDSWKMFLRRPVLGWGMGTFPTVYPGYRSFYTNDFINEAHNDYAQLLVESGVLGFGAMIWFLILLYRHGLPRSRRWEFRWDGALSLAALLGCTGILFHSFVDFNLQIPANAAVFYVFCALAASKLRPRSSSSEHRRSVQGGDESHLV